MSSTVTDDHIRWAQKVTGITIGAPATAQTIDPNPPSVSWDTDDAGWREAATRITANTPYGPIVYMKIQAPNINRLIIPLNTTLSNGPAASAALRARLAEQETALKPLVRYVASPDAAAKEVAASASATAADEARTAELAKQDADLLKRFGHNLATQLEHAKSEVVQAMTELQASHLNEKAAELREQAEQFEGVLETLTDVLKDGLAGAKEGGIEGAEIGAALSLAKNLIKAFSDNKALEKARELEARARDLHIKGVSEQLASAQATIAEVLSDLEDVENGGSVARKVAERDKQISVDRFDAECDCKFRFGAVANAVKAARNTLDAATLEYRAWGGAVALVGSLQSALGVFEFKRQNGDTWPIDGKQLLNDSHYGQVSGSNADTMRQARLQEDNRPVTDAILKDATKYSQDGQQQEKAAQELLTKLQVLHDRAFQALTDTPGKGAKRSRGS